MAKEKRKKKEETVKKKEKAVKKERKPKKPSSLEVWGRFLLENYHRNNSLYPKAREYEFYTCGNATMSKKDFITVYYTIDGYPGNLNIDFRDSIRYVTMGGVKVSFISSFEPTAIDWSSQRVQSKIKTWSTIEDESEEVNNYNYWENIANMDSTSRRKESLVYLADAEIRRMRKLFRYRTMMVVSGVRGDDFDTTLKRIEEVCKQRELKITRVTQQIFNFLKAFSPMSMELDSKVLKQVGNNTIPDEMIARMSSYDQGKVGKTGIIWGVDIKSGFPVYKKIKKTDVDAENILITAETGGGKSFLIKWLLIQLLMQNEYNGTINDIEGKEYMYLAGLVANHDPVVILDLSDGSGNYFDPVAIRLSGNKELDEDMFSLCKSYTTSVVNTLLGTKLLEKEWTEIIVDTAVGRVYANAGVVQEDMSTWSRSKGLGLKDIYFEVKKLYSEVLELEKTGTLPVGDRELISLKKNEDYRKTLELVVAKMTSYFGTLAEGGTKANMFVNKVGLEEVVRAKLVVNSFGLAGKDPSKLDPIQLGLSQLYASIISHLRSIFSKAEGKYNFKVWEEFQRWGAIPGSELGVKTAITGGRKLGDINIIISNNVKELLDEDRFGIFGNITSFAIGAIDDSDVRERLCERLSIPLLKGDLAKLVTKKTDTENSKESTSIYDKAFLVRLDKSVSTIIKVSLPKHISQSNIFKTGVNQDKVNEDELITDFDEI